MLGDACDCASGSAGAAAGGAGGSSGVVPTWTAELEEAWPLVVDYMQLACGDGSAWVLPALQANPGCRVAVAHSYAESTPAAPLLAALAAAGFDVHKLPHWAGVNVDGLREFTVIIDGDCSGVATPAGTAAERLLAMILKPEDEWDRYPSIDGATQAQTTAAMNGILQRVWPNPDCTCSAKRHLKQTCGTAKAPLKVHEIVAQLEAAAGSTDGSAVSKAAVTAVAKMTLSAATARGFHGWQLLPEAQLDYRSGREAALRRACKLVDDATAQTEGERRKAAEAAEAERRKAAAAAEAKRRNAEAAAAAVLERERAAAAAEAAAVAAKRKAEDRRQAAEAKRLEEQEREKRRIDSAVRGGPRVAARCRSLKADWDSLRLQRQVVSERLQMIASGIGIEEVKTQLMAQRLQTSRKLATEVALMKSSYLPAAAADAAVAAAADAAAKAVEARHWEPIPTAVMTDYAVLAAYEAEVARSSTAAEAFSCQRAIAAAKEQLAVQKRFAATVETAVAALNVRYCKGEFCDSAEACDFSCHHHLVAVSRCIGPCKLAGSEAGCGDCEAVCQPFVDEYADREDCIGCSRRRVRVCEAWSSMLPLVKQGAGVADAKLGCSEIWDVIAARATEALVAPLFAEDLAHDRDADEDDDTESRCATSWQWPARSADALLERFRTTSEIDCKLRDVRKIFAEKEALRVLMRDTAAPHYGCHCVVIGTRRMCCCPDSRFPDWMTEEIVL